LKKTRRVGIDIPDCRQAGFAMLRSTATRYCKSMTILLIQLFQVLRTLEG